MVTSAQIAEQLMRRLIRDKQSAAVNDPAADLSLFKRKVYKGYEHAAHLALLDSYLMRVTRYVETGGAEGIGRLIIAMPPRHGKTLTTSRLYPIWHLGRNPRHRVMLVSYGQGLANKNSRVARNILRSKAYGAIFPKTVLADDAKSVMEWNISGTNGEGGVDAIGIGGGATGKGANCFPAGTKIKTEIGNIDIDILASMPNPPGVLGYDHSQRCTVWADIVATRVVKSDDLIEITTKQGKRIIATQDHPVYVCNQGYVIAKQVKPDDEIISIKEDMPAMREYERSSQQSMPLMLRCGTEPKCSDDLFVLLNSLYASCVSSQENCQTELCRCVLFKRMFTRTSCNQKCKTVQSMWQSYAEQAQQFILFKNVQGFGQTNKTRESMPTVQERISSGVGTQTILHEGLRKQSPFDTYDWGTKFSFQKWDELFTVVCSNETIDILQGQICLCSMWHSTNKNPDYLEGEDCLSDKFNRTSYQRESSRQHSRESNHTLQNVPCNPPQVSRDTVSMVRRIYTDAQPVYDLQVDVCHNFFANGILVHNCLIIDDPLKSREQAESQTYRDKIWDAYTDDLYTRLEPGGAVIVMATRWHQDDLTGRILKRDGGEWTQLILPALAREGDVLGRMPGAALWPDRYDEAALLDIKRTQGEYSYSALYDQDPRPSEGGILKRAWFEPRVRVAPEPVRAVRYWDLAMSSRSSADYTVGLRIELARDGTHTITDIARAQVELHDLPRFITDVMIADGPGVHQGFEQTGYMTRAIQQIGKDSRLARYVIKGYPVHSDKLTRVLPFAARAALGLIRLMEMPIADDYIAELTAFPYGDHDDMVDASSGAWEMINEEQRQPIKAKGKSYA